VGSAIPEEVSKWIDWIQEPIDQELIDGVRAELEPIHNWYYIEGRPENNDLDWPDYIYGNA
jgi:hypothetical protein